MLSNSMVFAVTIVCTTAGYYEEGKKPNTVPNEMIDEKNLLYAKKVHEFLWYLHLEDDQLIRLSKIQGISNKESPKVKVSLAEIRWKKKKNTNPDIQAYFHSIEKLNQTYLDEFKKTKVKQRQKLEKANIADALKDRFNLDALKLNEKEDEDFESNYKNNPVTIQDKIVSDQRWNFESEVKLSVTENAQAKINSVINILEFHQFDRINDIDLDIIDNFPRDSFVYFLDWRKGRDESFESESGNTLKSILDGLYLENAKRQEVSLKLEKLIKEIAPYKVKDAKTGELKPLTPAIRTDFISRAAEIMDASQDKIFLFRKKMERVLSYQISNPEFENVIRQYVKVIEEVSNEKPKP